MDEPLILVLQMPKVASLSWLAAIRGALPGQPVHHLHHVNPRVVEALRAQRAVLLSGDGEIPDWLADLEGQEGTIIVRVGQSSGETVDQWSRPAIAGSDLALVQFSSGSTETEQFGDEEKATVTEEKVTVDAA